MIRQSVIAKRPPIKEGELIRLLAEINRFHADGPLRVGDMYVDMVIVGNRIDYTTIPVYPTTLAEPPEEDIWL